jgi:hypothetical protein
LLLGELFTHAVEDLNIKASALLHIKVYSLFAVAVDEDVFIPLAVAGIHDIAIIYTDLLLGVEGSFMQLLGEYDPDLLGLIGIVAFAAVGGAAYAIIHAVNKKRKNKTEDSDDENNGKED